MIGGCGEVDTEADIDGGITMEGCGADSRAFSESEGGLIVGAVIGGIFLIILCFLFTQVLLESLTLA